MNVFSHATNEHMTSIRKTDVTWYPKSKSLKSKDANSYKIYVIKNPWKYQRYCTFFLLKFRFPHNKNAVCFSQWMKAFDILGLLACALYRWVLLVLGSFFCCKFTKLCLNIKILNKEVLKKANSRDFHYIFKATLKYCIDLNLALLYQIRT